MVYEPIHQHSLLFFYRPNGLLEEVRARMGLPPYGPCGCPNLIIEGSKERANCFLSDRILCNMNAVH